MDTLRKAYERLSEAQQSLKRKKERYDKKKRQLEQCVIGKPFQSRRILNVMERERKVEERERALQGRDGLVSEWSYAQHIVVRFSIY